MIGAMKIILNKKRLLVLGVVLIMALSIFALPGATCVIRLPNNPCYECEEHPCICVESPVSCDDCQQYPCECEVCPELIEKHRASAIEKLEAHYRCDELQMYIWWYMSCANSRLMWYHFNDGLSAIDAAINKTGIDSALSNAKQIITESFVRIMEERDSEMAYITSHFDLTDPKIAWDGNFPSGFNRLTVIHVVFRRTKEGLPFPWLNRTHFGSGVRRFTGTFYDTHGQFRPDYILCDGVLRKSTFLSIRSLTSEFVTQIIRNIESLDFVKFAIPVNNIILSDWPPFYCCCCPH